MNLRGRTEVGVHHVVHRACLSCFVKVFCGVLPIVIAGLVFDYCNFAPVMIFYVLYESTFQHLVGDHDNVFFGWFQDDTTTALI
mmetsp:Transcript_20235/g.42192  ORF Transcript_20235/g.42192 Transcript_20235/m.42192 type:complete len:84 (-) Transcript_20235:149-400(-)